MKIEDVINERPQFLTPAAVLKEIGLGEGDVVLDYGSGSGHWTIAAAKIVGPKGMVYAIEDNIDILKSLKSKADIQRLTNIDIEELNLEKENSKLDIDADFVIIANVFHFIENKDKFVKRLDKLIGEEGKVLVVDWTTGKTLFGPPQDIRLKEEDVISAFENNDYHFGCTVDAGFHHFGLLFDKGVKGAKKK